MKRDWTEGKRSDKRDEGVRKHAEDHRTRRNTQEQRMEAEGEYRETEGDEVG